ncbi:MAG TPA: type II secretion system F family protein [Solirubrobacteraceae bacterium]|jgi:tight adherence protein C|nr:type II secretion system F family protein [Solirubrobacteraceae bacterium]
MTVLFVIGLLFVAAAIVLVIRAVALPRMRMATHLRQIDTYGFSGSLPGEDLRTPTPLARSINALAESVGRMMGAHVTTLKSLPNRELASAGLYRVSSDAFHGYRTLASVILPALLMLEVIASGKGLILAVVLAAAASLFCWILVGASVRHRSEIRLKALDRELPELIDVLIATIEAGLGFAGSLQLVAGRFEGPLGNELKLAQQEQRMGLSTNQALGNILERSDTPAMRSFVRAVVQGETLGVSIGTMMRNLAIEMRTRRRQAAQERVQKAPLKMLFPLIFLIFPAMLIVLLYPAVHELLTGFSKL